LNGCTSAHGLIWIDTGVGVFTVEEIFDDLSDFWDTGGTAYQNNFIDVGFL